MQVKKQQLESYMEQLTSAKLGKEYVKGFSVNNEAEVDFLCVCVEFLCFFHDPTDVGHLISDSSVFSKSNLYICKFLVHVLLKPSLKDFQHYLVSM